jgi:Tfp pilus assembly protein PilV
MKCRSKTTPDPRHTTKDQRPSGFTLVEAMASVTLLAFIGAGVWIVVEQCSISAADSAQKMRAFETARDNMEKLLAGTAVEESTEYGTSEQYPDIRWQTTVETFYMPANSKIWVRAVASVDYTDSSGKTQTISLTNWLTELSDDQVTQLSDRKALLEKLLIKHLLDGDELAAQYAGVSVDTVRAWVKNGMPTFDGAYIKPWLDLYMQTNGQPNDDDKKRLLVKYPELETTLAKNSPSDLAQPQQAESSINTEAAAGTSPDTTTEISAGADSVKLPENLDPEVKKQIEDMLKKRK